MRKTYQIGSAYSEQRYVEDPFTITPTNGVTKISFNLNGSSQYDTIAEYLVNLKYSFDKYTWKPYKFNTVIRTSSPVYFIGSRSSAQSFVRIYNGEYYFVRLSIDENCKLSGNLDYLYNNGLGSTVYSPKFGGDSTNNIPGVFNNNSYITDVEDLKFSNNTARLEGSALKDSFKGCINLTKPMKVLPKTGYPASACESMYEGCTSLLYTAETYTTPTDSDSMGSTFKNMYKGCTALTQIKGNPIFYRAPAYFEGMYEGCTSLTNASNVTIDFNGPYGYPHSKSSVCKNMFKNCTSLVTGPVFSNANQSVDTGYSYAFESMFEGCSSLANNVPVKLPYGTSDYMYYKMFKNCASLTNIPTFTNGDSIGSAGMYEEMFNGCTSLKMSTTSTSECPNSWKITTTTISVLGTANMFANTSGTFTGDPSANVTYYSNLITTANQR